MTQDKEQQYTIEDQLIHFFKRGIRGGTFF